MKRVIPLVLMLVLATAFAPATAFASSPFPFPWTLPATAGFTIFDSTVTPLPGNLPSLGFQASHTSELGDEITFAGSSRALSQVTVTLDSWACETGGNETCVTTPGHTFSIPITLTIYNVGANDSLGSIIDTMTPTFNVPYRPSADTVRCTGDDLGAWYDNQDGSCYPGLATNITFDFSSLGVALPDTIIYGISFNTTTYGPAPIGTGAACFSTPTGCPYDSLNFAFGPDVVVGSKPHPDTLFWNTSVASNYCDSGTAGVGVFRLDSPTNACWGGYVPAVKFTATPIPVNGENAWLFNFLSLFGKYFH